MIFFHYKNILFFCGILCSYQICIIAINCFTSYIACTGMKNLFNKRGKYLATIATKKQKKNGILPHCRVTKKRKRKYKKVAALNTYTISI